MDNEVKKTGIGCCVRVWRKWKEKGKKLCCWWSHICGVSTALEAADLELLSYQPERCFSPQNIFLPFPVGSMEALQYILLPCTIRILGFFHCWRENEASPVFHSRRVDNLESVSFLLLQEGASFLLQWKEGVSFPLQQKKEAQKEREEIEQENKQNPCPIPNSTTKALAPYQQQVRIIWHNQGNPPLPLNHVFSLLSA